MHSQLFFSLAALKLVQVAHFLLWQDSILTFFTAVVLTCQSMHRKEAALFFGGGPCITGMAGITNPLLLLLITPAFPAVKGQLSAMKSFYCASKIVL